MSTAEQNRIWQPDAMPVNRGVLVQSVLYGDANRPALLHAQCQAGNRAIISPYSGPKGVRAGEVSAAACRF